MTPRFTRIDPNSLSHQILEPRRPKLRGSRLGSRLMLRSIAMAPRRADPAMAPFSEALPFEIADQSREPFYSCRFIDNVDRIVTASPKQAQSRVIINMPLGAKYRQTIAFGTILANDDLSALLGRDHVKRVVDTRRQMHPDYKLQLLSDEMRI
jgi:hypothetical protein